MIEEPPDDDDLVASYRFELPERLVAQRPLTERSASRLLVLRAGAAAPEHRTVRELPSLVDQGDLLVVNDTSVLPARLFGEKAGTGGRVELLLVREHGHPSTWVCLLSASKGPRPGTRLVFGTGQAHSLDAFFATVQAPVDDEPGAFLVRFEGDPLGFARAYGRVPLPPYIAREDDADDVARYQTVFADQEKPGSSAAPRVVDALVTNFHLPGSTLFALACATAGRARMRAAYQEAIDRGYRFYSYGDACLLEVRR